MKKNKTKSKNLLVVALLIIAMNLGVVQSFATNKITYVNGVLLVNKQYALPKSYNPGENKEARNAFENMKKDAAKSSVYLTIFSGFRSYSYQHNLYWNYVARDGQAKADTYSARPGNSEHQTGLAFDIGGKNSSLWGSQKFANTAEGKWLRSNAHKYGFILRYDKGKEHITGYIFEPWHFRYVGKDLAKKIYDSGLSLEEYLGVYKNGWQQSNSNWYYYENNKYVVGWKRISNKWYYFEPNGLMVTGWKKISNDWYYLNSSGEMATGWKRIDNKWYYLNPSGEMVTGWKKLDNKWYYLNPSGDMATGWKKLDNKWYYLEPSGEMVTGWKKLDNKWYYLNPSGEMATGWKKLDNKWYYLNPSGDMVTGWKKLDNKWYYLKANGEMATGWVTVSNETYYLKSSGEMITGWNTIEDKKYFFKSSGSMATGFITIDDKVYYFYIDGQMAVDTVIDGWEIDSNGVATEIVLEPEPNPQPEPNPELESNQETEIYSNVMQNHL